MTSEKETKLVKLLKMNILIRQNRLFALNLKKTLPDPPKHQENANFTEGNPSSENDALSLIQNVGNGIIVSETFQGDERNESVSSKGGKFNLRPSTIQNYSEEFTY